MTNNFNQKYVAKTNREAMIKFLKALLRAHDTLNNYKELQDKAVTDKEKEMVTVLYENYRNVIVNLIVEDAKTILEMIDIECEMDKAPNLFE